jgi:transposase
MNTYLNVNTPAPAPLIIHFPTNPHSRDGQPRKRGAQSQNTNAFKHGIYSKRSPNAIALNMTLTIQRTREANLAREKIKQETTPSGTPVASARIPREVKARIQLMELTLKAQSLMEKTGQLQQQYDLFEGPLRLLALASNAVTLTSLYKVKLRSWEQRQLDKLISKFLTTHDLTSQQTEKVRRVLTKTYSKYIGKKLSSESPSPISALTRCFFDPVNWVHSTQFYRVGWHSTPAYLPGEGALTTFNGLSSSSTSFLHDRAWQLLQPHIEDLLHQQRAALKRRSRATPYPVRFLMDGILWKLATGTKWDALPEPYPLRRCQQLYLQLCRAGLMPHLLKLLHEDLVGYGDTDLETLLQSGRFVLYRNRVLLLTKTSPTWQELIALLLLQCGQKTALRVERLNPPPFSERRLPGYRPGLSRLGYLREPAPYQPFVPPPLPKKYTLKGWHFIRIPAPFCHPLVCRGSTVIASHRSFHGGVAISSNWQNGRPLFICGRPPRLGDPPRPELSWGFRLNYLTCPKRGSP